MREREHVPPPWAISQFDDEETMARKLEMRDEAMADYRAKAEALRAERCANYRKADREAHKARIQAEARIAREGHS